MSEPSPRAEKLLVRILMAAFSWLGFFILALSYWIDRKFGHVEIEQILYHLQFGGEGVLTADLKLVSSFLLICGLVPLLSASGLIFGRWRLGLRARSFTAVAILILGCAYFSQTVSMASFEATADQDSFFSAHYVKPVLKDIRPPQRKKNLILIYVESLEATYGNSEIFGRNLLAPLENSGGVAVDKLISTFGTTWTMAGIVASQCGIPLKPWIVSDPNKMGRVASSYLPGAVCLGDILKGHGYKNVFFGGADSGFGGKKSFLTSHGYDEVWGRAEWIKQGEASNEGWGLHDDRLLQNALSRIDALLAAGEPFNFTLLTVDTHHPSGHFSPVCKSKNAAHLLDIVECTSQLLADFIVEVRKKDPLYTEVIVMGDHLAMQNTYTSLLNKAPQRLVFNRFFSPQENLRVNRSQTHHFSILPTALDIMGFEFPQRRLGLGASIFGELDPGFVVDQTPGLDEKLNISSRLYRQFWTKP